MPILLRTAQMLIAIIYIATYALPTRAIGHFYSLFNVKTRKKHEKHSTLASQRPSRHRREIAAAAGARLRILGLPTGFYENPREARENIHGSSGWTGQTDMNLRGKFTFRMEAGESRLPRPPIRGCTMGMLCIAPCGL